MSFVPLFCKSHHSPQGVASPADLVRRARNLGYTTLGLCDDATIAGFYAFDAACTANGIRPVYGCRLFMGGAALTGLAFPIDFMIETEQGYRNLVRLLTRYLNRGEGERQPLRPEDLAGHTGGLLPVIPPDGELTSLIQARDKAKTERFFNDIYQLFEGRLWVGLDQPTGDAAAERLFAMRLARFAHLPPLAAPLVYFPEPGDAAAAVYLANPLKAPTRSYQTPVDVKGLPALWSEDEVVRSWEGEAEDLPHEAGNIARRCTWRPGRVRRAFPSMDLERGYDVNTYLFDQVIRGATLRYGEITESLKQRINQELENVKASGLGSYLLLCQRIAQALDDMGVSRGVGRGRVVSSVLAYCLGISLIDPIEYSLLYQNLTAGEDETFPAVRIEVPHSGMPPLLQWLRETYGEDHLAEIGRIQDLRRDQMINDLADWAGMTAEERRLAHREKFRLRSAGAAQRLSELAEGARSRRWRDATFLDDVAARLAPRPRHWVATGDRFALSGEPLDCVLPRVRSHQGRPVAGVEERGIDQLGVARIVFAGHGLLDILDQGLRMARQLDQRLDPTRIPLTDKATFDLLGRGDTTGIPPLENIVLRAMLRKQEPRNLLQLLRIKAETSRPATGEPVRELGDELPDVLLSYQCAYLKANYPLAFFAAAVGSVIEQRGNPSALIREAARHGIGIQPPDVNLSDWGPQIHAGNIRLGLAAVKGLGRKAWENILAVRSGGNFTSLESFCHQVDTRVVGWRLIRSLIASGAMDGLEQNRSSMEAAVLHVQRKAREEDPARDGGQPTLFEMEEWTEEESAEQDSAHQPEEWNAFEKSRREAEALGFFLSIDPVRRFRIALEHLKPLEVERLGSRQVGRTVRVVGLVGGDSDGAPLLKQPGERMVDLEGLPVRLTANLARVCSECLAPGSEVLVIGRATREDGWLCIQAEGLWTLASLEEQATRVARLQLNLKGENRSTLKLLLRLLKDYPGATAVDLADYPGPKGFLYRRVARLKVFFCSPLFQSLCKILPPESVAFVGHGGEPLLVKTKTEQSPDEADAAEAPEPDEEPE